MPAAHDIYMEQLRELGRGQALYHPEPLPREKPVAIGDVGYTKQGAFRRLFNACRPADDPINARWGVPASFQRLVTEDPLTFEMELEPGPLHSKTISRARFDIRAPRYSFAPVLPVDASFSFSCTSSQGAIVMLETAMSRETAEQEDHFMDYLRVHCLSWYDLASEKGIRVTFGDLMLVTECSKTAAWASAVYSQCSGEFGLAFSVGGTFLPISHGRGGDARLGTVERRRSQRCITSPAADVGAFVKDQTIFIKAYRPGLRSLYSRSIANKIMKLMNINRPARSLQAGECLQEPSLSEPGNNSGSDSRLLSESQPGVQLGASDLLHDDDFVTTVTPVYPDFHPAVALLAHAMETTDVDIAIVHDDEWCSTDNQGTARLIDKYADYFFRRGFFDGANLAASSSAQEEIPSNRMMAQDQVQSQPTQASLLIGAPGILEGEEEMPLQQAMTLKEQNQAPDSANMLPSSAPEEKIPWERTAKLNDQISREHEGPSNSAGDTTTGALIGYTSESDPASKAEEDNVPEDKRHDRWQESLGSTSGRIYDDVPFQTSSPDILSWTSQDPRESQLFNSWGVLYRFQTAVSRSGQSVTTLWRAIRPNQENRVAKLEWSSTGGLGHIVIGKKSLPMADLVIPDPRRYGVRFFQGPDGFQYRWQPSPTSLDILLQDSNGAIIALFHPTRVIRYPIGDVFGELHFFRTAGAGTVIHPPMMDIVTVTAMLYRFCVQWNL